jgi:ribose transport system permease protein
MVASLSRFARRNSWVLGLWVLFGALLVFTRIIQPNYGAAAFAILALAALPYAFATAGQTLVVISGGIDLSIAAMMAFIGVTAAVLMEGQADEFGLLAVPLILGMGLVVGAINGAAVVVTRVPDIVVTLAFFFIWEGAALMVTDHPDGGVASWLKQLVLGTVGFDLLPHEITQWLPKALLLMLVAIGIVWIPLRRSRLGISMYAIGSDRLAAFRSGVAVDRTRVAVYSLAGLFAAMGGLAIVMNTGVGSPIQGPYLLASVAAVVLGGVSLAGGKGGLVGPLVAVFILRLVRQDLTFMAIDPNVAQVVEGLIMVSVVMLGGVVALRSRNS